MTPTETSGEPSGPAGPEAAEAGRHVRRCGRRRRRRRGGRRGVMMHLLDALRRGGEEDERRRRQRCSRTARWCRRGPRRSATPPPASGWGSVPPPRLPGQAHAGGGDDHITGRADGHAADRRAAGGRAGSRTCAQAAPAVRAGVQTQPVMSPAKRRGCAAYGPAVGHGHEPAGGPAAGAAGAGQVAAVEPDALAAVVYHPGLALVVGAEDGGRRLAPACRPRRTASGPARSGRTPAPRDGGHAPRGEGVGAAPQHVAREPGAPAVVRDEEALAVTAGDQPARGQLGRDGHEPAPWIGPERSRADGQACRARRWRPRPEWLGAGGCYAPACRGRGAEAPAECRAATRAEPRRRRPRRGRHARRRHAVRARPSPLRPHHRCAVCDPHGPPDRSVPPRPWRGRPVYSRGWDGKPLVASLSGPSDRNHKGPRGGQHQEPEEADQDQRQARRAQQGGPLRAQDPDQDRGRRGRYRGRRRAAAQLAQKRLDKAAAKGIIHKNQAARRKSRMMKAGGRDRRCPGLTASA